MLKRWAFFIFAIALLVACGAQPETSENPEGKTWSHPPEMTIERDQPLTATIVTTKGDIKIELFTKDAPKTVNNFVFLARENFYDNVVFHRIMKDFMIQTGDPLGNGTGGPGYYFEDELPSPHRYQKGIVAMANARANTNGSQFFICSGHECEHLNNTPNYTIFGRVIEGIEVVDEIANVEVTGSITGESSKPLEKVFMEKVIIEEEA